MGNGYSESDLVANRTAVLLYGGSEDDRRNWAEEAARHFSGDGPLRVVGSDAELPVALQSSRGVVFVPNVGTLSDDGQLQLVRCLREREERPKLVVALTAARQSALDKGMLRMDLDYALALGRVDLDTQGLRSAIAARRGAEKKAAARAKPRPAKRTKPSKPAKKAKKRR